MKLTKILLVILLFSFTIVNAGGPIAKGCPLEGYEKNEYCPSYYTIGKVKKLVKNLSFTKEENLRGDLIVGDYEGKNYILGNNYFYDNGLKNIKESFFVGEGWINMGKINKNDIIIIDNFIEGYENSVNFTKDNMIKSEKFIKNKIGFKVDLKLINTYGNYYKVTCQNDIISLSNENKDYDLGFQHNEIIDKKVSKEIVRKNLQKYIKTCDNFNELFDIKYDYKNNKNYKLKLNKYKININKRFGKILTKITGEKKLKLLNKIEEVRKQKNEDDSLTQDKKDNINILFDALIEILNKEYKILKR